ncbi:unnamed protein product, partial [Amoebophrya sp. A25]
NPSTNLHPNPISSTTTTNSSRRTTTGSNINQHNVVPGASGGGGASSSSSSSSNLHGGSNSSNPSNHGGNLALASSGGAGTGRTGPTIVSNTNRNGGTRASASSGPAARATNAGAAVSTVNPKVVQSGGGRANSNAKANNTSGSGGAVAGGKSTATNGGSSSSSSSSSSSGASSTTTADASGGGKGDRTSHNNFGNGPLGGNAPVNDEQLGSMPAPLRAGQFRKNYTILQKHNQEPRSQSGINGVGGHNGGAGPIDYTNTTTTSRSSIATGGGSTTSGQHQNHLQLSVEGSSSSSHLYNNHGDTRGHQHQHQGGSKSSTAGGKLHQLTGGTSGGNGNSSGGGGKDRSFGGASSSSSGVPPRSASALGGPFGGPGTPWSVFDRSASMGKGMNNGGHPHQHQHGQHGVAGPGGPGSSSSSSHHQNGPPGLRNSVTGSSSTGAMHGPTSHSRHSLVSTRGGGVNHNLVPGSASGGPPGIVGGEHGGGGPSPLEHHHPRHHSQSIDAASHNAPPGLSSGRARERASTQQQHEQWKNDRNNLWHHAWYDHYENNQWPPARSRAPTEPHPVPWYPGGPGGGSSGAAGGPGGHHAHGPSPTTTYHGGPNGGHPHPATGGFPGPSGFGQLDSGGLMHSGHLFPGLFGHPPAGFGPDMITFDDEGASLEHIFNGDESRARACSRESVSRDDHEMTPPPPPPNEDSDDSGTTPRVAKDKEVDDDRLDRPEVSRISMLIAEASGEGNILVPSPRGRHGDSDGTTGSGQMKNGVEGGGHGGSSSSSAAASSSSDAVGGTRATSSKSGGEDPTTSTLQARATATVKPPGGGAINHASAGAPGEQQHLSGVEGEPRAARDSHFVQTANSFRDWHHALHYDWQTGSDLFLPGATNGELGQRLFPSAQVDAGGAMMMGGPAPSADPQTDGLHRHHHRSVSASGGTHDRAAPPPSSDSAPSALPQSEHHNLQAAEYPAVPNAVRYLLTNLLPAPDETSNANAAYGAGPGYPMMGYLPAPHMWGYAPASLNPSAGYYYGGGGTQELGPAPGGPFGAAGMMLGGPLGIGTRPSRFLYGSTRHPLHATAPPDTCAFQWSEATLEEERRIEAEELTNNRERDVPVLLGDEQDTLAEEEELAERLLEKDDASFADLFFLQRKLLGGPGRHKSSSSCSQTTSVNKISSGATSGSFNAVTTSNFLRTTAQHHHSTTASGSLGVGVEEIVEEVVSRGAAGGAAAGLPSIFSSTSSAALAGPAVNDHTQAPAEPGDTATSSSGKSNSAVDMNVGTAGRSAPDTAETERAAPPDAIAASVEDVEKACFASSSTNEDVVIDHGQHDRHTTDVPRRVVDQSQEKPSMWKLLSGALSPRNVWSRFVATVDLEGALPPLVGTIEGVEKPVPVRVAMPVVEQEVSAALASGTSVFKKSSSSAVVVKDAASLSSSSSSSASVVNEAPNYNRDPAQPHLHDGTAASPSGASEIRQEVGHDAHDNGKNRIASLAQDTCTDKAEALPDSGKIIAIAEHEKSQGTSVPDGSVEPVAPVSSVSVSEQEPPVVLLATDMVFVSDANSTSQSPLPQPALLLQNEDEEADYIAAENGYQPVGKSMPQHHVDHDERWPSSFSCPQEQERILKEMIDADSPASTTVEEKNLSGAVIGSAEDDLVGIEYVEVDQVEEEYAGAEAAVVGYLPGADAEVLNPRVESEKAVILSVGSSGAASGAFSSCMSSVAPSVQELEPSNVGPPCCSSSSSGLRLTRVEEVKKESASAIISATSSSGTAAAIETSIDVAVAGSQDDGKSCIAKLATHCCSPQSVGPCTRDEGDVAFFGPSSKFSSEEFEHEFDHVCGPEFPLPHNEAHKNDLQLRSSNSSSSSIYNHFTSARPILKQRLPPDHGNVLFQNSRHHHKHLVQYQYGAPASTLHPRGALTGSAIPHMVYPPPAHLGAGDGSAPPSILQRTKPKFFFGAGGEDRDMLTTGTTSASTAAMTTQFSSGPYVGESLSTNAAYISQHSPRLSEHQMSPSSALNCLLYSKGVMQPGNFAYTPRNAITPRGNLITAEGSPRVKIASWTPHHHGTRTPRGNPISARNRRRYSSSILSPMLYNYPPPWQHHSLVPSPHVGGGSPGSYRHVVMGTGGVNMISGVVVDENQQLVEFQQPPNFPLAVGSPVRSVQVQPDLTLAHVVSSSPQHGHIEGAAAAHHLKHLLQEQTNQIRHEHHSPHSTGGSPNILQQQSIQEAHNSNRVSTLANSPTSQARHRHAHDLCQLLREKGRKMKEKLACEAECNWHTYENVGSDRYRVVMDTLKKMGYKPVARRERQHVWDIPLKESREDADGSSSSNPTGTTPSGEGEAEAI